MYFTNSNQAKQLKDIETVCSSVSVRAQIQSIEMNQKLV